MTREEKITSLRGALEWFRDDVEVLEAEVDPVLEAGAIHKAFDDGPVILAQNLKGYPHARMVLNFWSKRERLARVMGIQDYSQAKLKMLEALKNPIPPEEVQTAPCQEVFIPREKVDPLALFPMVKYTELDGGRFFGNGVFYIDSRLAGEGTSQLTFHRMSFRGRDYASINLSPGQHTEMISNNYYNSKVPVTVNICPPPTVELMGCSQFHATVFPHIDEVGAAGYLQGSPVEVVKAKTVDAYAIANAEWVIEGYIVPSGRVWETEEAEKLGKQGVTMFHPEWTRYLGRAYRSKKFELTAVTHRKDKPIFFFPWAGWAYYPSLAACVWELGERLSPGFVQDINISHMFGQLGGAVLQVKKRRDSDEGLQRNLLGMVLEMFRGIRIVVTVDEDINVWSADDVMWAMTTRVNPNTGFLRAIGGRRQAYQPGEAGGGSGYNGGVGIDATVPYAQKERFIRARFSVDKFDFHRWLSDEKIKKIKAQQSEYFHWLGESGYY